MSDSLPPLRPTPEERTAKAVESIATSMGIIIVILAVMLGTIAGSTWRFPWAV